MRSEYFGTGMGCFGSGIFHHTHSHTTDAEEPIGPWAKDNAAKMCYGSIVLDPRVSFA